MVNIRVICVGNLKEKYLKDACAEYIKRLGRFVNISILELKEAYLPDTPSDADIKRALLTEGKRILDVLKVGETRNEFVIASAILGESLSSEAFSQRLDTLINSGQSSFAFIIGGSYGLDDDVLKRANMLLSFSKMTFPHQLFRVMLLEQVYRSFKILNGEKYHK